VVASVLVVASSPRLNQADDLIGRRNAAPAGQNTAEIRDQNGPGMGRSRLMYCRNLMLLHRPESLGLGSPRSMDCRVSLATTAQRVRAEIMLQQIMLK